MEERNIRAEDESESRLFFNYIKFNIAKDAFVDYLVVFFDPCYRLCTIDSLSDSSIIYIPLIVDVIYKEVYS